MFTELLAVAAADPSPVPTEPASDISTVIDTAGPIAGIFVLLCGIALVLLLISMFRQMKKIDPALPKGRADREREADEEYTEEAVAKGEADQS